MIEHTHNKKDEEPELHTVVEDSFVDMGRETARGRIHDLPRWAE
jgi:hypothetical protein